MGTRLYAGGSLMKGWGHDPHLPPYSPSPNVYHSKVLYIVALRQLRYSYETHITMGTVQEFAAVYSCFVLPERSTLGLH